MRTNMSVTIVAMVNESSSGGHGESCLVDSLIDNQTHRTDDQMVSDLKRISNDDDYSQEGEFNWDETMQGHILGSYYYGYIVTNINGGQLADRFGPRWLCGMVTLISAVLTLVTPFVARWDVYGLILLRVFTGLCQVSVSIRSIFYWIPFLRHNKGYLSSLSHNFL